MRYRTIVAGALAALTAGCASSYPTQPQIGDGGSYYSRPVTPLGRLIGNVNRPAAPWPGIERYCLEDALRRQRAAGTAYLVNIGELVRSCERQAAAAVGCRPAAPWDPDISQCIDAAVALKHSPPPSQPGRI
jgi:hypothetical protein